MTTTCYAKTPVYMHPAVFTMRETARPQLTTPRGVAPGDVRALLHAAGSLSIADIAGGLDVTVVTAQATVSWMLSRGELRLDEWNRLRAA